MARSMQQHGRKLKRKSVIQNIPKLTREVGLEGVNEDIIVELLQSHGESLTNDELRELAEQCIQSEFTVPDAVEEKTPVRELHMEFHSSSINVIMQIMDQFIDDVHYLKAQCVLSKSSLCLCICMYCSEFHKNFLINFIIFVLVFVFSPIPSHIMIII